MPVDGKGVEDGKLRRLVGLRNLNAGRKGAELEEEGEVLQQVGRGVVQVQLPLGENVHHALRGRHGTA